MARLHREIDRIGSKTAAYLGLNISMCGDRGKGPSPASSKTPGSEFDNHDCWEPIDAVRTVLCLLCYASWDQEKSVAQEAFGLMNLLAQILVDTGLEEDQSMLDPSGGSLTWRETMRQESSRRSTLSAVSFLNSFSIAYNVFPHLRSNEVRLRLPCSTKEWDALGPSQWQAAKRQVRKPQLLFNEALSLLVEHRGSEPPLDPLPSPFGNYLLMHGLLRRITIVRDLSVPLADSSAALPSVEADKLERALRAWTLVWQLTPESSVDPSDDVGRIPSTSSAMLSLAYVRIHLNTGPHRDLESRDPCRIAAAMSQCPAVKRSDALISALLYATHSLSIPVRLGIDRVARHQVFYWSVRHSLAGLESAVMLSKWLIAISETLHSSPLTDPEAKIIYWIRCIIEEASCAIDLDYRNSTLDPKKMNLAVLKIWAHFFKRNTLHIFINIIGEGLENYRQTFVDRAR